MTVYIIQRRTQDHTYIVSVWINIFRANEEVKRLNATMGFGSREFGYTPMEVSQ